MIDNNLNFSVITAPQEASTLSVRSLFLAGGISNCPDWQSQLINLLSDCRDLTIFNPRRPNYPMDNPNEALNQIEWEYEHLKTADMIAVWFSKGSVNPIVLYELGIWINARPEIPAFVGIDPGYERTRDVQIQTKLARTDIQIVGSISELAEQVKKYLQV